MRVSERHWVGDGVSASAGTPVRIPILAYHSIAADEPAADEPVDQPVRPASSSPIAPFTSRACDFAEHLDLIVSGGHPVLTVAALVDLLENDQVPAPGTVVITFDDGFDDTLRVAAPLLRARGLPATVFVTTGLLPGCPEGTVTGALGAMVAWDCLADLEAAGLEVGAHAHTHRPLDLLSRRDSYSEICLSKRLLEAALGHQVGSFAYPHGYASRSVQDQVRQCGFRSACGVRNAFSHPDDNRWLLARLTVRATTTRQQVGEWLAGEGASVAGPGEQVRTKGWRAARRAAALASRLDPRHPVVRGQ